MWFWLKISNCQSTRVHEGCWVNCPTGVGNLEASTVCWRESARWIKLSGYQAAVDHIRHVACGGRCLSQEDKPKKTLISSWNFAWNCHSLFKCAQDNSPRSPAQIFQTSCSSVVWSQSQLSSHSLITNLTVCNKSGYCSLLNLKLNNK